MQRAGGWVLTAGWAAKQGAIEEDRHRVVPAWGGGSGGGATLEAARGEGMSSMGRLAGRVVAGVGSGWGVAAPWGPSNWQPRPQGWSMPLATQHLV